MEITCELRRCVILYAEQKLKAITQIWAYRIDNRTTKEPNKEVGGKMCSSAFHHCFSASLLYYYMRSEKLVEFRLRKILFEVLRTSRRTLCLYFEKLMSCFVTT
jgi:hypothetical protein